LTTVWITYVSQCLRFTRVSFCPMLWRREGVETRAVARGPFRTSDFMSPFV
jgi:hypothetical protein